MGVSCSIMYKYCRIIAKLLQKKAKSYIIINKRLIFCSPRKIIYHFSICSKAEKGKRFDKE